MIQEIINNLTEAQRAELLVRLYIANLQARGDWARLQKLSDRIEKSLTSRGK